MVASSRIVIQSRIVSNTENVRSSLHLHLAFIIFEKMFQGASDRFTLFPESSATRRSK